MLRALRNGVKSPIMKVFSFFSPKLRPVGVGDMTTGLIGGSDKAISAGDESLSPREVAVEFDRTRRNYLPNATMGEAPVRTASKSPEALHGMGVPRRGQQPRPDGHA